MRVLRSILTIMLCSLLVNLQAQTKTFEFSNPNAIVLDDENIELLTAGYWRVFKNEMESRGVTTTTSRNNSVCYYVDGTFFYNGSTGTWKTVEDKYIVHELDKEAQSNLNFGGVFSVLALNDSILTLTKLLTSSHDMKRTLYLKSSSVLTRNRQPNTGVPYVYEGTLDVSTLDSIRNMNSDQLFDAGFTLLNGNMIHIMTSDTMYVIRLDSVNNPYLRVPIP